MTRLSLRIVTLVLATLFPSRWIVALGAVFVALSLYARVYIGDHWISDSLGGVALGTAVAAAAIAWMRAVSGGPVSSARCRGEQV